jgi:hypothetical protein
MILEGCTSLSKKELILGKWEISTWLDTRNNSDILKNKYAPNFSVHFKKDSVYILEKTKAKAHRYKFKWDIVKDTLNLSNLGSFKILKLNKEICILNIRTRPIFTIEKKLHLETITLTKK